jgi:endonuclease-3
MQSNKRENLSHIITTLTKSTEKCPPLLIDAIIHEFGKNPYLILIACLLSLRARDAATIHVCKALFSSIKTPQQLLTLPVNTLEAIIKPIGFFKTKATILRSVSNDIIERFADKVPDTEKELLSIKGIGRKTAMLVLSKAFDQDTICVDVHVHRISNRLGLVKTKTPHDTEVAIANILPKKYWTLWNTWLVLWGQNVCRPVSPKCSTCLIAQWCDKIIR